MSLLRRAAVALARTAQRHHRALSSHPSRPLPSERDIITAFRTADYATAIQLFARRPAHARSDALHEAAIVACASVPDAAAAQAVLRAMHAPTVAAVASVAAALCRERNVHGAFRVLRDAADAGVAVDARLATPVGRAAERAGAFDIVTQLDALVAECHDRSPFSQAELQERARHNEGKGGQKRRAFVQQRARPLAVAGFFVEHGDPVPRWPPRPPQRRANGRQRMQAVIAAERRLRTARGDLGQVQAAWGAARADRLVQDEVGPLAAAVDAFVVCGTGGGGHAVRAIMQWVRERENDVDGKEGKDNGEGRGGGVVRALTERPSAGALLLTSLCKALGAAATATDAMAALQARDAVARLGVPRFVGSLPLTGAYFKVLQHAGLSLTETRSRIAEACRGHVQLDEPAFSMALGALLRCDARVADKLVAARAWTGRMRAAGVPVGVESFNLLAGQLRYCNNEPGLISELLDDMAAAGVRPTPVTYGLCFSTCVMPGAYDSPARATALAVPECRALLEALQEHMGRCGTTHTTYSRLALARAYAHLGDAQVACGHFAAFRAQLTNDRLGHGENKAKRSADDESDCNPINNDAGEKNQGVARRLPNAFAQMIYNLAHARLAGADALHAAVDLHADLVQAGLPAHTPAVFDALLVAHVRAGDSRSAVRLAASLNPRMPVRVDGLKHLFYALARLRDPGAWMDVRDLVEANADLVVSPPPSLGRWQRRNTGTNNMMGMETDVDWNADVSTNAETGEGDVKEMSPRYKDEIREAVEHAVLEFARAGDSGRAVCDDMMDVLNIEVAHVELVRSGRDFSRLRGTYARGGYVGDVVSAPDGDGCAT